MRRYASKFFAEVSDRLKKLGNPQNNYKIIQITGTNGKGSVSSMIYSCLLEAGYKAGLYTKPALVSDREKIRVGLDYVDDPKVYDNPDILEVYFNALKYFSDCGCEIVVIENEVGGFSDYTYTLRPMMSIITNVDYDHQNLLGGTLGEITYDKCGVYKPCVKYPIVGDIPEDCKSIVENVCKTNNLTPIWALDYECPSFKSGFRGDYQWKNEKIACCAASLLGIDDETIERGLKNVIRNSGLRGRWETIMENPQVIVDVGHNMNAWNYHLKYLEEQVSQGMKPGLVFSMVEDRPIREIFSRIPDGVTVYICRVKKTKLASVEYMSKIAEETGITYKASQGTPTETIQMAIADGCDPILCSGGFFICGEILKNYPAREI